MLIVNKRMNEVGFVIEGYNGFTEAKEEELAKMIKNLKVRLHRGFLLRGSHDTFTFVKYEAVLKNPLYGSELIVNYSKLSNAQTAKEQCFQNLKF